MSTFSDADVDVVLSRLDDLHDGLSDSQREVLGSILAKAAADEAEVKGFFDDNDHTWVVARPTTRPSQMRSSLFGDSPLGIPTDTPSGRRR